MAIEMFAFEVEEVTARPGPTRREAGRLETRPTRGPLGNAPDVLASKSFAQGLGWLSIGLGLAEVFAPTALARIIGVADRPLLFRALGIREVLSGIGILGGQRKVAGVWSRVLGDALDLSLLGLAATDPCTGKARLGAATAAVCGVTALDAYAATRLTAALPGVRTMRLVKTIAINKGAAECYALWRDLTNLARFMEHVEQVEVKDERRSRWVVCGPAGTTVEWEAEIVRDVPDELIAWRSIEGSQVDTAGMVQFLPRPGGEGTLLRVSMVYDPPAGKLGKVVATLFGEAPEQQLQTDLRCFKQLLETGEVSTTEGQPAGRRSLKHRALARAMGGAS